MTHFQDSRMFYLVIEKFGNPWCEIEDSFESLSLSSFEFKESNANRNLFPTIKLTSGSCATLFDYIERVGTVPRKFQTVLFRQIAMAVKKLHSIQIVHGDIKEENILVGIGQNEDELRIKLCDFGHALKIRRGRPEMVNYGTRDITPPELLKKEKKVIGYSQDIWALGIVLYTIIHGQLPPNNDLYIAGGVELHGHTYFPTKYDESIHPGTWFKLIFLDCLNLLHRMLTIDPLKRIDICNRDNDY